MMLEYDWGNQAAAVAAAMMLYGDDQSGGGDTGQLERPTMFDHYAGGQGIGRVIDGGNCITDFFPQPQPLTAAALFSPSSSSSSSCHQRYGFSMPPPTPARIGLNLGVRTYFSSSFSPEINTGLVVGRVSRRRTRTARCQAEGCGADLTNAKHYHRRHKVCEFHSKASVVIAAGLSQRFCQQCSRFHVLAEFDQGKRSCRKRLADHNRRRRKSQDLTATTITQTNTNNESAITSERMVGAPKTISPPEPETVLFRTSSSSSTTLPAVFTGCKPTPPAPLPPLPALQFSSPADDHMALGLGCSGMVGLQTALSASPSSAETSPATSISFFTQLGELRSSVGGEERFTDWDETEEGSSIRELFQSCK